MPTAKCWQKQKIIRLLLLPLALPPIWETFSKVVVTNTGNIWFFMLFLTISSNWICCIDSSLNGFDLVAAKVKRVVWQGGWYPPTHSWGVPSYNWDCGQGHYDTTGCNGASQCAVNNMPPNVDMVYSVIGRYVISGNECIQRICSWKADFPLNKKMLLFQVGGCSSVQTFETLAVPPWRSIREKVKGDQAGIPS